jgi:c-di-GMP-binding flagellar brake protein YcgR
MTSERRTKVRYPIELTVQYQTLGLQMPMCGAGQTLNLSSSGMLITAEHSLPEGCHLRVTVEWPTLLNGKTALQLVTTGKVVRRQESSFGISFDQYQFRTRKQKPAVVLPEAVAVAAGSLASASMKTPSSSVALRSVS